MNLYDSRDAAAYIAERTGESLDLVTEFLEKQFKWRSQKNDNAVIAHSDDVSDSDEGCQMFYVESASMSLDDLTMEVAALKMQWFDNPRFSDANIARLIAAEISYQMNIGTIPPDVYPHVKKWAKWIAAL